MKAELDGCNVIVAFFHFGEHFFRRFRRRCPGNSFLRLQLVIRESPVRLPALAGLKLSWSFLR